ncbi:MAG: response regulator [Nitrospinota bacterium]|nr:MAG: response regulator [Nitrospinota bacterium]
MYESHQLEKLYRLSLVVGTTLDLEHEVAAFMHWLSEEVEPAIAALFITDEAKQELRLVGAHGFAFPSVSRLPLGLNVWRWLAEQGIPVPEEDTPRRYAVPIPIEKQLFGTLCLVSTRPGDQIPAEQRLVSTAAGYLAPVLRNISRYQSLEQRVAERTAALEEANRTLHTLSARLEALVQRLPDGVCLLDPAYRIILTNPRAQDYLVALTQDNEERLTRLGDRSIEELLIPPPVDPGYHEVVVESPVYRNFAIFPQPIEVGPVSGGWVLLIREMTQERLRQERILEQDRLATVGQLAAGIAHDFNNILNVIIGFSDLLLQDTSLPATVQDKIALIAQQGKRASRLIRQILDFSRHSIAERRPLDLLPFLKEQVKLLQRTLPETIHLRLNWTPGEYLVEADPTHLQQILTNLAVNARDAMPEGGELQIQLSRLTLSTGEVPPVPGMPAGTWCVLTVADTGSGIPSDVLPHVFEPFFTTKPPGQGTGLGLAQVYGLVKQHQGWIDIASTVGQGTRVTLYFPALTLKPQATRREEQAALPRGHGETVLLVEDESMVRQATSTLLRYLGYRVLIARNGEEALAIYVRHQEEIRVVLTDLVMPGMGGKALCQVLHRQNPTLPLLVMTGYPLGNEAEAGQVPGVQAWLPKPLSLERLAQTLQQVLQHT